MIYYFLKEDLAELENKITQLREQIKLYREEKGLSVSQSSETWHDNYGFEESMRQIKRHAAELEIFLAIKANSEIVKPGQNKAGVGKIFRIKELTTGKEKEVVVGSYLMFSAKKAVSYDSPLAKIILRGKPNQIKKGVINGKGVSFQIISVK